MALKFRSPMRWVVFDAVGTLLFAQPSVAQAYASIGNRYGSTLEVDEVRTRFREAFAVHERHYQTSEAEEFQFWKRVVKDVLGPVNDEAACFAELYEHFGLTSSWRVEDSTRDVIQQLQLEGLSIAIASNFDARLHRILDGDPVLSQVQTRLISSEVGWRKPSPEFFQRLVKRCGVPANEILMVGDDFDNDYLGARTSGLQAVLLGARPDENNVLNIPNLQSLLVLCSREK